MKDIPNSVRVDKGGKADYIRYMLPGHEESQELCVCLWNTDFSRGCIAHVLKEDLAGVIENNGYYPDIAAVAERHDGQTAFGCDYCYARYQGMGNAHAITPLNVTATTRADMERLKADRPDPLNRIIRLGKTVEVGHRYYRQTFFDFFKLVVEYEARTILPTKMLEYNRAVAVLLRRTDSTLNYSTVSDHLEEGPTTQHFDQLWRIEQAKKYHAAGVRTSVTLTCDVTASFKHNQDLGYAVREALRAHEEGVPLRLLPMRLPGKEVAAKATGRDWLELRSSNMRLPGMVDPNEGVEFINGSYIKKPGGFLEPVTLHPDFEALYNQLNGNNLGACGKARGIEHCDKCGLVGKAGKVPMFEVPISQLAPPPVRDSPSKKTVRKTKTLLLPGVKPGNAARTNPRLPIITD